MEQIQLEGMMVSPWPAVIWWGISPAWAHQFVPVPWLRSQY